MLACQNSSAPKQETSTAQSLEDSLYKAVIALHDEAMPKLGKIKGYQKTLERRIDSLNTILARKKDASTQKLKSSYTDMLTQLKNAEKSMNDWMDSFKPDPQLPSKADLEKSWTDQKNSAQKLRDDIVNAIDSMKLHSKE